MQLNVEAVLSELRSNYTRYLHKQRQLVNAWVQSNRKYPDGFKFTYHEEEAEITGANANISEEQLVRAFDIDELRVWYTCYVPSWCDVVLVGQSKPVGKSKDKGVQLSESLLERYLKG